MSNETETHRLDALSRELREAYARFAPLARQPRPRALMAAADIAPPPREASWDWRTHGVIGAPSSQLPWNTCTSFAISAVIEAALAIAKGLSRKVEPGFIHTCVAHGGTLTDQSEDCSTPADLGYTLSNLQARGYTCASGAITYPFPVASCPATATESIAGYTLLPDPNSIKTAIVQSAPVAAEMYIWPDFFDYRGATPVYEPDTGSGDRAYHSVCVIGFDALGWIIKNSLGPGWGIEGFATIRYGTCGLNLPASADCRTYSIQLPP